MHVTVGKIIRHVTNLGKWICVNVIVSYVNNVSEGNCVGALFILGETFKRYSREKKLRSVAFLAKLNHLSNRYY